MQLSLLPQAARPPPPSGGKGSASDHDVVMCASEGVVCQCVRPVVERGQVQGPGAVTVLLLVLVVLVVEDHLQVEA